MSFAFGKYLYQTGAMPFSPMLHSLGAYVCHKTFGKSLSWLHHQIFNAFFKSLPKLFLNKSVNAFLDLHLNQLIYTPAHDALCKAKSRGHVAILSSSPDFLVESIAGRFNVDSWIGTCYAVDKQDRLCEIACIVDGEYKAAYLAKLMTRYQVTKDLITAYSDSILDLPMLEAAGKKIGVNPDRKLYSLCKIHQWEII